MLSFHLFMHSLSHPS